MAVGCFARLLLEKLMNALFLSVVRLRIVPRGQELLALTGAQNVQGGEFLVGGVDHISQYGLQMPQHPLDCFISKTVSVVPGIQEKTRCFGAIVMGSQCQGIVGLIMEDKVALTPASTLLL